MLSSVELEKTFYKFGARLQSSIMRLPLIVKFNAKYVFLCIYSVIYMTMRLSEINLLFFILAYYCMVVVYIKPRLHNPQVCSMTSE